MRVVPGCHLGKAAHAVAAVIFGEGPVDQQLAVCDGEESVVGDELVILGKDGGGLAKTVGIGNALDIGDVLQDISRMLGD